MFTKNYEIFGNQKIIENKVNSLLDENTKLYDQYQKSEHMNNIERVLMFGLGILASVAAGFAMKNASK